MIAQAQLSDIPTLRLSVDGNTADICPLMGANPIRLTLGEADIYRTPPDLKAYQSAPNVYGEPLLFPPNRLNGGRFSFSGREYAFPINEPERGHHIHGLLSRTPFSLIKTEEKPGKARVDFSFEATKEHPYLAFPHTFSVVRTFSLSREALLQRVRVKNTSDTKMPVGVGFHTSLNLGFLPEINRDALRLFLPVKRQIMVDQRSIIPTGERMETALARALNKEGVAPQGKAISAHFERSLNTEARLLDTQSRRAVRYEVSPSLRYFMLWNAGGQQDFICPEPQSWIIDAPNQSKDEDVSGFRALAPGEEFEVWTRVSLAAANP